MKIIGRKVYQRKAPRVIRYQIRQQEIGRMYKVWSSPMWQVAPSPLEAVVEQYPKCRVVKHATEPTQFVVRNSGTGCQWELLVECKPATL